MSSLLIYCFFLSVLFVALNCEIYQYRPKIKTSKGFQDNFSVTCGALINVKSDGIITSDKYLNSSIRKCTWTLVAPQPDQKITLTVTDIAIPKNYDTISNKKCPSSYLRILDGSDSNGPVIGEYCGNNAPPTIVSQGSALTIDLGTYTNNITGQFSAHYTALSNACGGSYTSEEGTIASPNYPLAYPDGADCEWVLSTSPGNKVYVMFEKFDLALSKNCNEDYVEFRDYNETGPLIGVYCGNTIPKHMTKASKIYIKFHSDNNNAGKGFLIHYGFLHEYEITGLERGEVSSPLYPASYDGTGEYTWRIITKDSVESLSFTVDLLEIHTYGTRCANYLAIYDGYDDGAPILTKLCGTLQDASTVIRTTRNIVFIKLKLDKSNTGSIFHIWWAKSDSSIDSDPEAEHVNCGSNVTQTILPGKRVNVNSPDYPEHYANDLLCEWVYKASPGYHIDLEFIDLQLEKRPNCFSDYVSVMGSETGIEWKPIKQFMCTLKAAQNVNVDTSFMKLVFKSDDSMREKGFNAIVSSTCDRYMSEPSGEIGITWQQSEGFRVNCQWRIKVHPGRVIKFKFVQFNITNTENECYQFVNIHNGDSKEAPLLGSGKYCGYSHESRVELETSSNALFVSYTRNRHEAQVQTFRLHYEEKNIEGGVTSNLDIDSDPEAKHINCGSNVTQMILPGKRVNVNSPDYPEYYANGLLCEWVYKASPGYHIGLDFVDLQLEKRPNCFADYVSVMGSETGIDWKPIKEFICTLKAAQNVNVDTSFMKLVFKSDYSMGDTGFNAIVSSTCGRYMSEPSGEIGITWQQSEGFRVNCQWRIKVHPGRVIKFKFVQFNITNTENECYQFVTIHNGDSKEAPLLGSGKYCGYSYESRVELETSSNALFVSYTRNRHEEKVQTFRLHYEEKNIECGVTSNLDTDHSWEVFSTPNHPSIPLPHSECVWIFSGPVGEVLRVDFLDFDLKYDYNCKTEALELRDGTSNLAPLIGRYCLDKPGSIISSKNSLYIRYVTQSEMPNRGLKAKVSIDVCGSTIVASTGELSSPGYPHLLSLSEGTVCEWRITGTSGLVLQLKPQAMDLPDSDVLCATNVTIKDVIGDNDHNTLKTFCYEDTEDFTPIETSSNEVIIKYYVGKKSSNHTADPKGFRFTFNSSRPMCGGAITTPEGYITTPGYPRKTTVHYCYWFITVPDNSRRVRLEIEDYNLTDAYTAIYNDDHFQTLIQSIKNVNPVNNVYESSGNTLAVYVRMSSLSSQHSRFKAKFSSNEPALCGGTLTGYSGELSSPAVERSYSCNWSYSGRSSNQDNDSGSFKYNTILINAQTNSSISRTECHYNDPKLNIRAIMADKGITFNRNICGKDELQLRIPSDGINLKATQNKGASFTFHLDWKLQPCGGILRVEEEAINVLNVPNNYNSSLDCAWILDVPIGNRIKIKLEGSFKLGCSDEFIKISQGTDYYEPIGDYCKDRIPNRDLVLSYGDIYIQYHSSIKNETSIKLMTEIITRNHQCGGYLTGYNRIFTSPYYSKHYIANLECAWYIEAHLGNRVSLEFVDQFVPEKTNKGTKDMVIIYDWDEESYKEIARVYGRIPPSVFNSTNNKMKVVLRTDGDEHFDGFKARWSPFCGGKYSGKGKGQILYSPGFPFDYQPLLECHYEISAPGQVISIKFLEFELEGTYPYCFNDKIIISGQYTTYDYDNITYCGTEMPTPSRFIDKVLITFKTDRTLQAKGFKLSYSFNSCGGKVTEPAVITSGEGISYEREMNCTWVIEAPANRVVIVKFITMKIEGLKDCSYDFVELFNGDLIDYNNRIVKLCGFLRNQISVYRSTSNKMLMHFVTDGSVNFEGFKARIFFSYREYVGCGGYINLTETSQVITSPLIHGNTVYESFLDCHWIVRAPSDQVIKTEFISFHVSPCSNTNQTDLGNKCDCDLVEIKDGLNPDSNQIGVYCGRTIPHPVISSGNLMSIRLLTNGEIESSGFKIRLTAVRSDCGQSALTLSSKKQVIRSPGYGTGSMPRGLNCVYKLIPSIANDFNAIHVRINNVDLQPSDPDRNQCNKDKLTITGRETPRNLSFGSDYVHEYRNREVFDTPHYFKESLNLPKELQLCGVHTSGDYYLYGTIILNLYTSPYSDGKQHKGFEIEVAYVDFCGRNYTEPQGRIRADRRGWNTAQTQKDCYTLITAPENYTIAVYFISIIPDYYINKTYLEVFDGDKTSAKNLVKVTDQYNTDLLPVFSTGRHLLLYSHQDYGGHVRYDLNYITTNKGPGCGGKMHNEYGLVSSPLYPKTYRQKNTCEWELETIVGTKLKLHFSMFDLDKACNENYVRLVKRNGDTISTYCDEIPADYTSEDNYVKIVFATTASNGGTGWLAHFIGVV